MAAVEVRVVGPEEAGLRLDRWFRRHYPGLGHARLERLLRTGQVRIDGGRARAGVRLEVGQRVRVPPLGEAPARPAAAPRVSPADARRLRAAVLYRDDDIIAIDKPPGLAVQGGSRTVRHLDAMLDALRFGAPDRPRLVHRLDRDTSGVLVLARNPAAATRLAGAFRSRRVEKLYWALVVGRPRPARGTIRAPLAKRGGGEHGERMASDAEGKPAVTDYAVVESAGKRLAWLALRPRTGRTHQLRAHCAALGTPIVGDHKYGGAAARLPGGVVADKLHLHARALVLPGAGGERLRIVAPLPAHMRESWRNLGFDPDADIDPFAEASGDG